MNHEEQRRSLGRAMYLARIQAAWGAHWPMKDKWPADAEAWRAYPHHPAADVDLCLVQADAALKWWAEQ